MALCSQGSRCNAMKEKNCVICVFQHRQHIWQKKVIEWVCSMIRTGATCLFDCWVFLLSSFRRQQSHFFNWFLALRSCLKATKNASRQWFFARPTQQSTFLGRLRTHCCEWLIVVCKKLTSSSLSDIMTMMNASKFLSFPQLDLFESSCLWLVVQGAAQHVHLCH